MQAKRNARPAWPAFLQLPAHVLLALMMTEAIAAPISEAEKAGIETQLPATLLPNGPQLTSDPSVAIEAALRRGHWKRVCGLATDTLVRGISNVDALGTFGMCSALRNDSAATSTALQRLREAEAAPGHYAAITEGIVRLRNGEPEKAEVALGAVLKVRPADPLALYFNGEAQHQLKRDPQAIASFKAVLKSWPDYAPALASAARLLAMPPASSQALKEAVAMTERATLIEPMNLEYWKQMAELYDRAGQPERAAAVRLQWLNLPSAK